MAAAKPETAYIERGEKTSIDWISMRPILDPEIPESELRRYAFPNWWWCAAPPPSTLPCPPRSCGTWPGMPIPPSAPPRR